jgi:hypothetical protein
MPSSRSTAETDGNAGDNSGIPLDSVGRRFGVACLAVAAVCVGFVGVVAAGNGVTLSKGGRESLAVPRWLYVMTGGATIGASALLASFVTDRALLQSLHDWHRRLPDRARLGRLLGGLGRLASVGALVLVLAVGAVGPELPTANLAILLTFVGARAGLPIASYLLGSPWTILNPWRTIASALPHGFYDYPQRLQRWPAVVGVLLLVLVELVLPVSTIPRVLASVVAVYTALTVAGAVLFGPDSWFDNVDPWAILFRTYGAVGPIRRTDDGFSLTLLGSGLIENERTTDTSDVAFIIALVWELTFSGFVTTEAGATTIEVLVGAVSGVAPPDVVGPVMYTLLFIVGYLGFFGAYWYASSRSRRMTETYLRADVLALRFAPPLIAIAAGYHFAHYVQLFVSLSPALVMALSSPLSPPANPLVLSPPAWFDGVKIGAVLAGHVVAVFVAHAVAYRSFPSRLTAIRSQYPFVFVMIGYTVLSLWILSLPNATPPYLP